MCWKLCESEHFSWLVYIHRIPILSTPPYILFFCILYRRFSDVLICCILLSTGVQTGENYQKGFSDTTHQWLGPVPYKYSDCCDIFCKAAASDTDWAAAFVVGTKKKSPSFNISDFFYYIIVWKATSYSFRDWGSPPRKSPQPHFCK